MLYRKIVIIGLIMIICNSIYFYYSTANGSEEIPPDGGGPYPPDGGVPPIPPKKNFPPLKPVNPNPANNSIGIEVNVTLSIYVDDPDKDLLVVKFYNAINKQLIGYDVFQSSSRASITWSQLEYNTTYSWFVEVWDGIMYNFSDIFYFVTKKGPEVENHPPSDPSMPYPENNSKDVSLDTTISIYVEDIDGDLLKVDFYNSNNDLIGDVTTVSGSRASVRWSDLDYGKTYEWYACVSDGKITKCSPIYVFTTKYKNNAPSKPIILYPKNNSIDMEVNISLEVDVYDQDGDELFVSFYNGKDSSLIGKDTVIHKGKATVTWSNLEYGKTYSWYVLVSDLEEETKSDLYYFTTKEKQLPEPEIRNGWVYGVILLKGKEELLPAKYAKVELYRNGKEEIFSLTNEKGEFYISNVTPGEYTLQTFRGSCYKSYGSIDVKSGEGIAVTLTLDIEPERIYIEKGIESKDIGGEVIIDFKDLQLEHEVILYENISIAPIELTRKNLVLAVSGENLKTGKTLVIHIDQNLIDLMEPILVTYDGEQIDLADDIEDVLDPNNDGLNPEYIITKGAKYVEIIVSVPHFSQHELKIQNVVEVRYNTSFFYMLACILAAAIFIGVSYVRIKIQ